MATGDLSEMSDIPTTISPPSLLLSPTSSYPSPSTSSAPIPAPPIPSNTTSSSSVISRPPKRHVRPRATTDQEKQQRLEERKLANRTAAKQSRERQRQAMEQALRENERLREENSNLLKRLTNLEQRMQEIEASRTATTREGITSTHQPARPMKSITEPQCPTIPLVQNSTPSTPIQSHSNLAQTRILVYALQILMHSFVLSMTFPHLIPLNLLTSQFSHQHKKMQHLCSHPWMNLFSGYATPSLEQDLSGAIRRSGIVQQRSRVKSIVLGAPRRMQREDFLSRVRGSSDGARRRNANYVRLIIKKGKRMNK